MTALLTIAAAVGVLLFCTIVPALWSRPDKFDAAVTATVIAALFILVPVLVIIAGRREFDGRENGEDLL